MGLVIGLTGGIGSGKSAVSDRLAALGATIADADVASRHVVAPGEPALTRIVQHFGDNILTRDGSLDRAALRQIVFADDQKRRALESITVPAIMQALTAILSASTAPYSVLILSSGSGQSSLVQRNLGVDAPVALQLQRVIARDNNTRAQVQAIMATQPSREQRLAYADDVITNDGDLNQLHGAVDALHQQYLVLARTFKA